MSTKLSEKEVCYFFLFTLPKTKNLGYPMDILLEQTSNNCPIKVNKDNNFELHESQNNIILDIDGKHLNYKAVNLCKDACNRTYNIRYDMCVPEIEENEEEYQRAILEGVVSYLPSLKTINEIEKFKLSNKEISHIKNRIKNKPRLDI